MALCYTRLLCQRSLGTSAFRSLYTSRLSTVPVRSPVLGVSAVCETHDEKNMRLNRPMSPHLTIYQFQLTAVLSISHRATGMILSAYATTLGLGTLLIPGGMPCFIEGIESLCLPAAVLYIGKLALAFPATFHLWNGIRHLSWDLGMFLTIKQVYSTGYAVVTLAAISAAVLAAM